jgi:hypothetical protein
MKLPLCAGSGEGSDHLDNGKVLTNNFYFAGSFDRLAVLSRFMQEHTSLGKWWYDRFGRKEK